MGSGTIVGLLTGGGFVFLAALMVPVLSKRLNKSAEAAAADKMRAEKVQIISDAASEVVSILRVQLQDAEDERDQLKTWARKKVVADAQHSKWDLDMRRKWDRLVDRCGAGGIEVGDDLYLSDPPTLDIPFNGDK